MSRSIRLNAAAEVTSPTANNEWRERECINFQRLALKILNYSSEYIKILLIGVSSKPQVAHLARIVTANQYLCLADLNCLIVIIYGHKNNPAALVKATNGIITTT